MEHADLPFYLLFCASNSLFTDNYDYVFVQRIVDWLAESFKRDEGIDLLKDKQALQRLTETAEKAKIELSSLTQTNIRYVLRILFFFWILLQCDLLGFFCSLPFITATSDGPKHIDTTLTRAKFEELCADLLDRYSNLVSQQFAC